MDVVLTSRRLTEQAGVSLVEALVAVGLLFIIAAGILPLFSRAMVNNAMGNDGTRFANFARETGELGMGSNFDVPRFNVPPGATVLTVQERWLTDRLASDTEAGPAHDGRWFQESPAPSQVPADRALAPQFHRVTETRQFGVGQWQRGIVLGDDEALPGDSPVASVQLKVIDIEVRGNSVVGEEGGSSILGAQRRTRVTLIKAF